MVLVASEPQNKELQAKDKERLVVSTLEHGVVDVAHEVLKEGSKDHVDYLGNFHVNLRLEGRVIMERLELLGTSNVFLGC